MKWQLSLAAFSLGHRTVEFVTWFESLVRGCLEPSSENAGPCHASDEGASFDDSRLRRIEVEIHRILHFLKTSDCADQLRARAEHAIEVVDRTFILCLRFGEGSLLSLEINAELKESLRWLEEFRDEADIKAWRRRSRKVSTIIRGIISEFTSCFADMGDAFSEDLRCFYQLGREISEFQAMLPRVQELAENPLSQHLMVREKIYPVLLRLVKNCEEQAPTFSLKLDERINDRDFFDFFFDLQEAIETQLTRRAKHESESAKAKKSLQASTTGFGSTDTSASGTFRLSDATGEPNRPKTESPTVPEPDTDDVSAAKLIDTQLLSRSESESDTHRQTKKQAQALPHDKIDMPLHHRRHHRFEKVDNGVMIYGVLVPVEGIPKRVLVVLGKATHSAKDAQLRRAAAPPKEKKQSTSETRSQRLLELRKILRSAFKLPETTDPIPRIPKSNPPEWALNWQLLWDAAFQLCPDN